MNSKGELIHSRYSWDQYFMSMAYMASMKSKDPKTRVGCVIVGNSSSILSTGYNGLSRNVEDLASRYHSSELKYAMSNHAEENAILNAARNGIKIDDATLYTNWMPCIACSKSIIQVGIKRVVYHTEYPGNASDVAHNPKHGFDIAKVILQEANVLLEGVSCEIIKIRGLYKFKKIDV
ncbi:putative deoxycytidylate deaminase [Candidatus Fokinia solitaria]|uniref:Putative deoxycytidylate deaminase n=1 Tax=Candidatus Fokinia solitaria TaxID=1802984 RepID=A0A2U8BR68_9RICK|nr:dCMP deaminase family protein [Candidatus Fokinia solitaria]AWD32836.1 putative deoxycytidylate deaminase [Candidatus Fokinia solitaria]